MKRLVSIVVGLVVACGHADDLGDALAAVERLSLRNPQSLAPVCEAMKPLSLAQVAEHLHAAVYTRTQRRALLLALVQSTQPDKVSWLAAQAVAAADTDLRDDLFFALHRCVEPADLDHLAKYVRAAKGDLVPWLQLLGELPSAASFLLVREALPALPDDIDGAGLLARVTTMESAPAVVTMLSADEPVRELGIVCARRLLQNMGIDAAGLDASMLGARLQAVLPVETAPPKVFTAGEQDALLAAYESIAAAGPEAKEATRRVLEDEAYNSELNLSVRRYLDLEDERVRPVFWARDLDMSYDTFQAYAELLPELHAAEHVQRSRALLRLKELRDPRLVSTFLRYFDDVYPQVREDAADSIYLILADAKSISGAIAQSGCSREMLAARLERLLSDANADVQIAAIQTLVLLQYPPSYARIVDLAWSEEMPVQMAVMDAIAKREMRELGAAALQHLLRHPRWELRARAARVLWEIKPARDEEVQMLLAQAERETDDYVMAELQRALSKSNSQAVAAFWRRRYLAADDPASAAVALVTSNCSKADVSLVRHLFESHPDDQFRIAWLEKAQRHRLDDLRPEIMVALASTHEDVARTGVVVAGQADIDVRPAVQRLLATKDTKLAMAASGYLLAHPPDDGKVVDAALGVLAGLDAESQEEVLEGLVRRALGKPKRRVIRYPIQFKPAQVQPAPEVKDQAALALCERLQRGADSDLKRLVVALLLRWDWPVPKAEIRRCLELSDAAVEEGDDSWQHCLGKLLRALGEGEQDGFASEIIGVLRRVPDLTESAAIALARIHEPTELKALLAMYREADVDAQAKLLAAVFDQLDLREAAAEVKRLRTAVPELSLPDTRTQIERARKRLAAPDYLAGVLALIEADVPIEHWLLYHTKEDLTDAHVEALIPRLRNLSAAHFWHFLPVICRNYPAAAVDLPLQHLLARDGGSKKYPVNYLRPALGQNTAAVGAFLMAHIDQGALAKLGPCLAACRLRLPREKQAQLEAELPRLAAKDRLAAIDLLLAAGRKSEAVLAAQLALLNNDATAESAALLDETGGNGQDMSEVRVAIQSRRARLYQQTRSPEVRGKLLLILGPTLPFAQLLADAERVLSSVDRGQALVFQLKDLVLRRLQSGDPADWQRVIELPADSRLAPALSEWSSLGRLPGLPPLAWAQQRLIEQAPDIVIWRLLRLYAGSWQTRDILRFLDTRAEPGAGTAEELLGRLSAAELSEAIVEYLQQQPGRQLIETLAAMEISAMEISPTDPLLAELTRRADESTIVPQLLKLAGPRRRESIPLMRSWLALLRRQDTATAAFALQPLTAPPADLQIDPASLPATLAELTAAVASERLRIYRGLADDELRLQYLPAIAAELGPAGLFAEATRMLAADTDAYAVETWVAQAIVPALAGRGLAGVRVLLDRAPELEFVPDQDVLIALGDALTPAERAELIAAFDDYEPPAKWWIWNLAGAELNPPAMQVLLQVLQASPQDVAAQRIWPLPAAYPEAINSALAEWQDGVENLLPNLAVAETFRLSETAATRLLKELPTLPAELRTSALALLVERHRWHPDFLRQWRLCLESDAGSGLVVIRNSQHEFEEPPAAVRELATAVNRARVAAYLSLDDQQQAYWLLFLRGIGAELLLPILDRASAAEQLSADNSVVLDGLSAELAGPYLQRIVEQSGSRVGLGWLRERPQYRYPWLTEDMLPRDVGSD